MTRLRPLLSALSICAFSLLGFVANASPPAFVLQWGEFGSGAGQFHSPRGIAVAPNGQVFVVDEINNRIQVFTETGDFIRTWGSTSYAVDGFLVPQGVVTDNLGHVYITQMHLGLVQQFTTEGSFESAWHARGGDDITISNDGVLYVVESGDKRIERIDSRDGTSLGTFGSAGTGQARLVTTWGIGHAPDGRLYVADWGANNVKIYGANGTFLGIIGGAGSGPGQFLEPADVAVDSQGYVYVTDFGNDRVEVFNSTGGYWYQWGGYGLGPGEFRFPTGIAVGPDGDIYVCDTGNHRIQRFSFNVAVKLTTWSTIKALYAPKVPR